MGLRARLLLLVLLPTIPALVLAVYTSLDQRQAGRRRVEKDAIRVVQLAAAKQLALVDAARQQLSGLARIPGALGTNTATFDGFFATLPKLFKEYVEFGLLETNGELVASSTKGRKPTNQAERTFFQRALLSKAFTVGDYDPGDARVPANLPMAQPILDGSGQIGRVLYAGLDVRLIREALAKTALPEGAVIHVTDSAGRLVSAYPDSDQGTGETLAAAPDSDHWRLRKEGTAEAHALDGSDRLWAFTAVGEPRPDNLLVSVAIPLHLAYGETKHLLVLNLAVLGAVAGLALFAAWVYANRYILKPVQALAQGVARVSAGDLSTRTGVSNVPGELNALARAFDGMAASLERQRHANEEAQAALRSSEERLRRLSLELEDRVKLRTLQLEQANRELEAFSYSVSHDLRAPLRHIHGYVERLKDESADKLDAEPRRLLNHTATAAKRMGELIDDLLAFSRMNRSELAKSVVRTDLLVGEVVRELKGDIGARQIHWTIPPLPNVFADGAMLKLVWTNLLANAVKYTRQRERTEIRISCEALPDEFQFGVHDNGVGFDMRYVEKLFRVFERLHRQEDFEGTGIGLANVHRIITRHGGRTWAEAKPDVGASFYFTLPRPDPNPAGPAQEA
jgi:signal transduction histidine kinase